jgi:hypothetical protein
MKHLEVLLIPFLIILFVSCGQDTETKIALEQLKVDELESRKVIHIDIDGAILMVEFNPDSVKGYQSQKSYAELLGMKLAHILDKKRTIVKVIKDNQLIMRVDYQRPERYF